MILENVEIENYRNYSQEKVALNDNINLFIGDNGQGKTNFLEVVYYLALGRSFRNNKDEEIINWQKDYFKIKGILHKPTLDRKFEIEIIGERKGKRTLKINGVTYKRLADLLGYLQVVTFTPEDLTIVKDGPQERRRFIDLAICQLKKGYYGSLSDYYQVLRQRNSVLKELQKNPKNIDLLEVWNQQLVNLGSRIIKERIEFLKILVPLARKYQGEISQGTERLDITYSSLVVKSSQQELAEIKSNFLNEITEKKHEEIRRGLTLVGPHRDDLIVYLNNNEVRKFGSQGQQRSTILSLKLAQLKLYLKDSGEYPLLLLDDVMSELDDLRREYLLNIIRDDKVQTLITGANNELKYISSPNEIYYVKKGNIEKSLL